VADGANVVDFGTNEVVTSAVGGTETTAVAGLETVAERTAGMLREHASDVAGRLHHMTM